MARTFGTLTAHQTGLTTIGVLANIAFDKSAEVEYSHDADNEPDGDNGGTRNPATFSASLEIDGTVPDEKDTVTIAGTTYILTKVGTKYERGKTALIDIEGTEQLSGS